MSILDHAVAAARVRIFARAARDASVWAGMALQELLDSLRTEIRSRKAERALDAMSDRALKDIGVARREISRRVRLVPGLTGRYTVIDRGRGTAPLSPVRPRSQRQSSRSSK